MALLSTKLIKSRKKVFDKLRKKFFPNTTEVILLKQSATANQFDQIEILYDSWWFVYSQYRQNFLLEIAKDDPDSINLSMAEATHISIDGDVYVIRTGDTLRPKGTDATWKIYCDRFPERSQFKSLY
jgi:phosphoglucomutase